MRLNYFKFDDSIFKQHFAILVDVCDWDSFRYNGSWTPPANVWDEVGRFFDQNQEFDVTYEVIKETTYKNRPVSVIEIEPQTSR